MTAQGRRPVQVSSAPHASPRSDLIGATERTKSCHITMHPDDRREVGMAAPLRGVYRKHSHRFSRYSTQPHYTRRDRRPVLLPPMISVRTRRAGALRCVTSDGPGLGGPGGYRTRDHQIPARESRGNGVPKQPEHGEKHVHPTPPHGTRRLSNHVVLMRLHPMGAAGLEPATPCL